MTEKEFVEETCNIEEFYGKELNQFENKRWFEELRNMSLARYRQVIRQAFRKCKFMPKLADIISIEEELPYAQTEKKERTKVECNKCKGEGLIFYKRFIDNGNKKIEYEYVARCDCQNGTEFYYDGTKISDSKHRSKFYIPLVSEIGI